MKHVSFFFFFFAHSLYHNSLGTTQLVQFTWHVPWRRCSSFLSSPVILSPLTQYLIGTWERSASQDHSSSWRQNSWKWRLVGKKATNILSYFLHTIFFRIARPSWFWQLDSLVFLLHPDRHLHSEGKIVRPVVVSVIIKDEDDDDEEDNHDPRRHLVWWWFQSGRPLRRSSASTRLSWVLSNLSANAKYVDIDWNSDYFAQCLLWASLPSLCSQERCLMVRLQTSPVPISIKSWKLKMPNVLIALNGFALLHTHMRRCQIEVHIKVWGWPTTWPPCPPPPSGLLSWGQT